MHYKIHDRAITLLRGGYYTHEVISILAVEFDLDEFQTEDLAVFVPKWKESL